MFDTLIKNGLIVDGTRAPSYHGDIAITAGEIAEIGKIGEMNAEIIIDAANKVVAPGFIDMHSHADLSLLVAPEGESLVRQGITTVVGGQCGLSPAPLTQKNRTDALKTIHAIGAPKTAIPIEKMGSFGNYLDFLDSLPPAINVVPLIGQGMVRSAVLGYGSDAPDDIGLSAMRKWVEEAMGEGAFGISTGLIYPPGSFSTTEELIEVVKPVAQYGGLYFSHMRNEASALLPAIDEAIQIGTAAGVGVQISHFKAAGDQNWGLASPGLERIERAQSRGIDVTADMYPYTAGSTHLGALLPTWVLKDGLTASVKYLAHPDVRQEIIAAMKAGEGGVVEAIAWDKILICRSPKPEYLLRHISDLAEEAGMDPYAWMLDAYVETRGDMGMVNILMSEENVRAQLKHPLIMIGTDGLGMAVEGPMAEGMLHPRCFGTYPRLFGMYVREEGVLELEEASWKASGFPAQKLGLNDRGVIKKGLQADLVIFDPETIRDTATYSNPLQYPTGIDYVFVNGRIALQHGVQSSDRFGRVIRRLR